MRVLFLFGPNLGALGARDPERYGTQTLDEIMGEVGARGGRLGHQTSWRQSDHEGELIAWLHGAAAEGCEADRRSTPGPSRTTRMPSETPSRDAGSRSSRST